MDLFNLKYSFALLNLRILNVYEISSHNGLTFEIDQNFI